MKSTQLAALYAASKASQPVVIDTAPRPERLQEQQPTEWRAALQQIRDIYCKSPPQQQLEIRELLKRACD